MSTGSIEVEAGRVRRAVSGLREGPQRRYSPALRRAIQRVARARLAGGRSRAAICEELGVSSPTLDRMLTEPVPGPQRGPSRSAWRPVHVRAPAPTSQSAAAGAALVARCPGGVVVEGLDVAGVAALVRALA